MAEILEEFDFTRRRRTKYPWDEWFDGRIWKLVEKKDYQVTTHGIMGTLSQEAKRRHIKIKLPGLEDVSIPEIDRAAAAYVDARDNRMRLFKEEIDASDKLLAQMKKHHQTTYAYDSAIVSVLSKTKVSVKRAKDEEAEAQEWPMLAPVPSSSGAQA